MKPLFAVALATVLASAMLMQPATAMNGVDLPILTFPDDKGQAASVSTQSKVVIGKAAN